MTFEMNYLIFSIVFLIIGAFSGVFYLFTIKQR